MLKLTPLLLFVFALSVRAAAIAWTGYDGLYGQDPYAYFDFALKLRAAWAAAEVPPAFFWPMGYPFLTAIVMSLFGEQPLAGQVVSAAGGALVAPLVYLLVLEIRPQAFWGALTAGLLGALSAQLVLSSLAVMADAAGLFWTTASALALLRYHRSLRLRWVGLASATLAMATVTRWGYGPLIVPWSLSVWLAWRAARCSWRHAAAAAGVAACAGLAVAALHFAPSAMRGELGYAGDLNVINQWTPAHAFSRAAQNQDGVFRYEHPTGLYNALPLIHPSYVFPLLTPFLVVGLISIGRERSGRSGAGLAVLIGWPIVVYLILAGLPWQNWRFPLSFFSPLLVMVGVGTDEVLARSTPDRRRVVGMVVLVALTGSAAWMGRDVGRFTRWKAAQLETARAVEAQVPPGATLLVFEITPTIRHYTTLSILELFTASEADVAAAVSAGPVLLLLNVDNVEAQWAGKPPHRHFEWLRQHTALDAIGHYAPYTLFRVLSAASNQIESPPSAPSIVPYQ